MNPHDSFDSTASFASTPFLFCGSNSLSSEIPPGTSNFAMFASHSNYALNPSSPPSELPPPTLSNASAASIPSNNPSTVGSPYSAHAHVISGQEPWSTGGQGLGLGPTIINHESYDQGFRGVDLDPEMSFGIHGKVTEDFVGECTKSSPSQNRSSNPAFSEEPQLSHSSPFPIAVKGRVGKGCVTVDAVLEQANSAIPPSLFRSSRSGPLFTQSSSARKENLEARSQQSKIVFQSPSVPASSISKTPVFSKPSFISAKSVMANTSHSGHLPMKLSSFDTTAQSSGSSHTGRFQSHSVAQSCGDFRSPLQSSCSLFLAVPFFYLRCCSCRWAPSSLIPVEILSLYSVC